MTNELKLGETYTLNGLPLQLIKAEWNPKTMLLEVVFKAALPEVPND